MSDHNEQRRREALAERNEERQMLHSMLSEPGRNGLSKERAAALQEVFKRRYISSMPKSDRGLAADEESRLEGLAEMAVTRVRNSLTEGVEEEEEEEEGPISDGVTMSYALNGKPCTKEELDKEDIPRRIIKGRNEQRLAQSTKAPVVSFLAQNQEQRAEVRKIHNLYEEEWAHYRNFEVREQKVEEEKSGEGKDVVIDTEEDNIVENNAEQKLDVESKSDEVA